LTEAFQTSALGSASAGGRDRSSALSRNVAIVALALICLAFVVLFWPAMVRAVEVWIGSRSYNHGFLIIPVSLYLIWERRDRLRGLAPAPALWALLGVLLAGVVWFAAYAIGIYEGQQFAILAILQFVFLAVLGPKIYVRLLFPFLFLFFLVPSGDFLVPYLQDFTARFTVLGLRLTGIPVYSDGVFLSIPGADFQVAEACAGLRFLVATVAFGFLFADLAYTKWRKRVLFVAISIVVPVIANGFRAYGIVMMAWLANADAAGLVDHVVYGWVFFSMVTLLLMAIGWQFRDREVPQKPRALPRSVAPASPLRIAAVAAAAFCLVALPRAYAAYAERAAAASGVAVEAPRAAAPWTSVVNPAAESWGPAFPRADATVRQSYAADGRVVDLFLAYYRNQTPEKRLIAYENRLVDDRWDVADRAAETLRLGDEEVPVAVTRYRMGRRTRIVYSVYWTDSRFAAGALTAKLLQARATFVHRTPEAAVIALSTELREAGENPTPAIADLLAHLDPTLPALLARASAR
jgi:exosortase A